MGETKFRLPAVAPQFGIAIFPCLKTSAPLRIGGYTFRSTTDLAELPDEQVTAVTEIAAMLYARDDVRIAKATYAITEPLGSLRPGSVIERLYQVRAVVGYLYSSPHPTQGVPFMPFEFASLAMVQPANVSTFLVRPEYGTILPPLPQDFIADDCHETLGYEGVYNRRPLWLVRGSRLYGGHTNTTLNVAQDLSIDIGKFQGISRSGRDLLLELLERPLSPFGERIMTAIDWYNRANDQSDEPDRNLLSLAVAFEVLLELPSSEKTERLTDGIALLLGRTARLKDWASQFYAARSQVAHEGRVRDWWFYSESPTQKGKSLHRFGSVMTYGLEIFQLCLTTILTGAKLAEKSQLAERFIANSERYIQITQSLSQFKGSTDDAIASIKPLVDELDRYQFVSSPTSVGDVIKALRAAAKALSQGNLQISEELTATLNGFCDSPKQDDFAALIALEALERQMRNTDQVILGPAGQVVAKLIEVGWRKLFMVYYQIRKQREAETVRDATAN